MKTNAPEKIYIHPDIGGKEFIRPWLRRRANKDSIEYTRTDAFIEKVINFLNYKLDDVVAIRVPGTIIPHRVGKQELIEDLKKDIKG